MQGFWMFRNTSYTKTGCQQSALRTSRERVWRIHSSGRSRVQAIRQKQTRSCIPACQVCFYKRSQNEAGWDSITPTASSVPKLCLHQHKSRLGFTLTWSQLYWIITYNFFLAGAQNAFWCICLFYMNDWFLLYWCGFYFVVGYSGTSI